MKKIHGAGFIFFLSLILVSGISFAQLKEMGTIQGKVSDEQGIALPGASVTASSPNLMGTRSAITNESGQYRIPALPVGTYTIEVNLEGFTSAKRINIQLNVGMTVTVDVALSTAALAEEVTVIGEAPLIDITDTSMAKTIITKDFFENIPTDQNTADIVNLAPGVVDGSSYGGGDFSSNAFKMDGVDLATAYGGEWSKSSRVDYNTIEEAQVMGLGAPAEYGDFTGSVVNIITKSGGNEFSGDGLFRYRGFDWNSDNFKKDDPQWSLLGESPVTRSLDASFHLGGPMIKDKLWFFAGFEYVSGESRLESADKSSPLTFPKVNFKLTFQLSQKSRLQVSYAYYKVDRETIYMDPFVRDEANTNTKDSNHIGLASFVHQFSTSTLFEARASIVNYTLDFMPSNGDTETPGHIDLVTGAWTTASYLGVLTFPSRRFQVSAALSHYADDFAGSHDFKFGVEYGRGRGEIDWSPNGDLLYLDIFGYPYLASGGLGYNVQGVNKTYTFYAQDSWKISESFVINPGIRYTLYRGSVRDETVYTPTGLGPRIGFVWDIFKTHKTVFKAHFGRYYENTKSFYIDYLSLQKEDAVTYFVPAYGTLIELFRTPPENLYSIDPDIKHSSVDQFSAGIEQVIGQDFTLSLTFIYKDWNDFIEPVNVLGMFAPVPSVDPETGEVYTVYNQLNPGQNQYLITNPEKGKDIGAAFPDIVSLTPDRKYRALQISLTKRFSNNWQLYASYVYSDDEGNYSNYYTAYGGAHNVGKSTLFQDPNYQINLQGLNTISAPHQVKIQATYALPLDIILSAYYTYSSGWTWTRQLNIFGLYQGSVNILTEPHGSRRLPAKNILDLRVEKSFNIKDFRLRFWLDIFNLFNQGRETAVFQTVGPTFGMPTAINAPRSFLAGFRFMF